MSRWPPDTAARLKRIALDLFAKRGFANVTAAEIAERAGMTERTFFRHFRAKEDVLFDDYSGVKTALADAVAAAPDRATALDLMSAVARFLSDRFGNDRETHRVFAAVVKDEPTLLARSLLRDQEWGQAVAQGLIRRGVASTRADLIATVTATIFRVAYQSWATDESRATLDQRFEALLGDLSAALGAGVAGAS